MSVLTRKEQNAMLGVNNEMMARSQVPPHLSHNVPQPLLVMGNGDAALMALEWPLLMITFQRMQIKAEPAELLAHTQDEVLRPGEVPNHLEQSIWRYISKGADKFPVSTYVRHFYF